MPLRRTLGAACLAALALTAPVAAQPSPPSPPLAPTVPGPIVPNLGRPRVAVVLQGGVARGFAYLGALEALVTGGVPVDLVVGTSAGALVSGLYSAGYSFESVRAILGALAERQGDLLRLVFPPTRGLIDLGGFEAVYRELVAGARLEATSPPLAVIATELSPGAPARALTRGDLADAVRASISIPVVFPAATFEGRTYVDGGLREPVPVGSARALGGDFVIALRSAPPERPPPDRPESLFDTFTATVGALAQPEAQPPADVAVRVRVDDTLYFDFGGAAALIERGLELGRSVLPQVRAALEARGVPLDPPGDPHEANPVNEEWPARLERGLAAARALPRALEIGPQLELGPSAYTWGTRPAPPQDFGSLAVGAGVGGGPLGPLTVSAGYVKPLNEAGSSGYARLDFTPNSPFVASFALDPYRRPAGAPWELAVGLRFPGVRLDATADALAFGLGAGLTFAAATVHGELEAGGRVGNALFGLSPGVRLEGRAGLEWRPGLGGLVLRGRLLGGLTLGEAQGFALGAPSRLRGYPADYLVAPEALIGNFEVGYRFGGLNVFGLAIGAPELRVFADAGLGRGQLLWDFGVGVTVEARLFGLVPFTAGLDVAYGGVGWRLNLFTRAPLP